MLAGRGGDDVWGIGERRQEGNKGGRERRVRKEGGKEGSKDGRRDERSERQRLKWMRTFYEKHEGKINAQRGEGSEGIMGYQG